MQKYCCDLMKVTRVSFFLRFLFVILSFFSCGALSYASSYEKISSISMVKNDNEYAAEIVLSHSLSKEPKSFSMVSPAKIIVDLPDTETDRPTYVLPLNLGGFDKVYVAQLGNKTRLVFLLHTFRPYHLRKDGNRLLLSLLEQETADSALASSSEERSADEKSGLSHALILDSVDFRKGKKESGLIVLGTGSSRPSVHVNHVSDGLTISLLGVWPKLSMIKSYDVSDFYTPVHKFTISREKDGTFVRVYTDGAFEDRTFEAGGKIAIELKKIESDEASSFGFFKKRIFSGQHISLHFQNTTIRSVLQAIADFTRLNILVTDKVNGNLTIRLDDVPWDQALSIILESANLGMRRNGAVVVVGTRDELLESEKQYLQSEQQINNLEQVVSMVFHLNYQKADAVEQMLNSKNRILSDRGSVIIDPRTNKIFVEDIPGKLKEIEKFIKAVDIPVAQVLIEARIVAANSTFNRSLGVRLGNTGMNSDGIWSNSSTANAGIFAAPATLPTIAASSLNVNFPAVGESPAGFAWSIFNAEHTALLNLEITALEADGKGKTLANPRVVTSDKQPALIEQGTDLPYTTVQGTSGTQTFSTIFKKVNLSLNVTPQIAPNNHIILDVEVSKDSVSSFSTSAGPGIDTKHVKTQVLVENGGTLVIGGIYEDNDNLQKSKVPFLGDIPVVGNLFKGRTDVHTRSELIVFITPRVIHENGRTTVSFS